MQLSTILKTLAEHKAKDVVTIDVRDKSLLMDTVVVCTATSSRHAKSMAKSLIKVAKSQNQPPAKVEGLPLGNWVLVHLAPIVIHIMLASERELYQLESMWAPSVAVK